MRRPIAGEAGVQVAFVKNTCTPVSRILVTLSNNARFRLDYADCLAADVTVMLAAVVPHDQEAGVITQFDPTADAVLPLMWWAWSTQAWYWWRARWSSVNTQIGC